MSGMQQCRWTRVLLVAPCGALVMQETDDGHTWFNWRDYLTRFAPQLFRTS